ncbi:MAG: hypothetical protein M0R06_07430 [Sphaerochaeta sp.]|jgi:hypothetical protein|nr:hypothetical protein [Sphaerochaeta sp.]
MSPNGYELQEEFVKHLRTYVPYVRAEGSNARYDVIAYIPDNANVPMARKQTTELACYYRYRRTYCEWKKERIERGLDGVWRDGLYRHILDGKEVNHYQLWAGIKERCKCDEDPNCEQYLNQGWRKREPLLPYGLNLFEIKSDVDNHSRLVHQIPQMMEFADHAWLVLGDEQTIPVWCPPYVGVIRYAQGKWAIEQQSSWKYQNHPKLYWQALAGYGLGDAEMQRSAKVLHQVRKMMQAWFINSVFHWEGMGEVMHGPIVDMTPYLDWASDLRAKAKKVNGDKKAMPKKIEDFFNELGE